MNKTSVNLKLWSRDKKEQQLMVEAYTTDTPGLVVHKAIDKDYKPANGCWVVTHQASGMAVDFGNAFSSRRQALAFAASLNGATDWTWSYERMRQYMTPEGKRWLGERLRKAKRAVEGL